MISFPFLTANGGILRKVLKVWKVIHSSWNLTDFIGEDYYSSGRFQDEDRNNLRKFSINYFFTVVRELAEGFYLLQHLHSVSGKLLERKDY